MQNHAKILDCTLRDGAYLIDKNFGVKTIHGIIHGLLEAKIDYIEIGFLQNDGFGDGKTIFLNSADAGVFVPQDKKGSKFTVLADYSRYDIYNLDPYTGNSFDAVRACFFKHERFEVLSFCREIKEKGYELFVQPVDILGYTDSEILEFISRINELEPYCLSIVDTFGSMYEADLQRLFFLIHHNLTATCKIGFHSHNNLQMSSALAQAFLKMSLDKREVVIDATIAGMGRGAGNTPTELVAQYMVSKAGYNYNLDSILDIIDSYVNNIRTRCTWGYNTPYFLAGCYSAHVNNISYLLQKNSLRSKDIRFILNKIGSDKRKRYDYDLLEETYLQYLESDVDDRAEMEQLKCLLKGRPVLIMAPGNSIDEEDAKVRRYISEHHPTVIGINFIKSGLPADYLYFSNVIRYHFWSKAPDFKKYKKIVTSNIGSNRDNEITISFLRLIKCGFEHLDNSCLMVLRLLDQLEVESIGIAGFDGYDSNPNARNYIDQELELPVGDWADRNQEITEMLKDYLSTRAQNIPIHFVTTSRFQSILEV